MAVHHITNEMVADREVFVNSKAREDLIKLLSDHVVVAHNAGFDIQILKNEGVEVGEYIDTLRVARHLLDSESYGLQYLRYSLNLKVEADAHDAWGDILVLEALFTYLQKVIMRDFNISSDKDVLAKMLELTKTPVLLEVIVFGKYKGWEFSKIALEDRGYLEWLYKSESEKSELEQNEELVYTLRHYLD